MSIFDVNKLSDQERLLLFYWSEVNKYIGRDISTIWTEKVQRDFFNMRTSAKRIEFLLKHLCDNHYIDKSKFANELMHIELLISHLSKIKPKRKWIRKIYSDLELIIADVGSSIKETAQTTKKFGTGISRRTFLKQATAAGVIAASPFGGAKASGRFFTGREWINKLNSIGLRSIKSPWLSNNPKAPTIIMLEDVHGSPQEEWDQIRLLYTKANVVLFGVEGWAGHEIDRSRGRRVLNAEVELVKILLKYERKGSFQVIGLEDVNLQFVSLERHFAVYSYFINVARDQLVEVGFSVRQFQKFFDLIAVIIDEKSMKEDNHLKVKSNRDFSKLIRWVERQVSYPRIQDMLKKIGNYLMNLIESIWELYGIYPPSYSDYIRLSNMVIKKHSKIVKSFSKINDLAKIRALIENDPIWVGARNEFAAEKFINEMRKRKANVAGVVFGKTHLDGLRSSIWNKTNGNINILVI
ncbi:hypothetical protein CMO93_02715 [Candidatus Woesearchaeota archaeon]|nr:hypothetical protein [Candidatus Woesearchaeota archaeon]|tara:strand:- start:1717 stop:3117 length:1401 start_codon:yes stop_codon:yes gene_type:complete